MITSQRVDLVAQPKRAGDAGRQIGSAFGAETRSDHRRHAVAIGEREKSIPIDATPGQRQHRGAIREGAGYRAASQQQLALGVQRPECRRIHSDCVAPPAAQTAHATILRARCQHRAAAPRGFVQPQEPAHTCHATTSDKLFALQFASKIHGRRASGKCFRSRQFACDRRCVIYPKQPVAIPDTVRYCLSTLN